MNVSPAILDTAVWGLAATVSMTVILEGSRGLGLSRLSLPFILGTALTGHRDLATITGFVAYVLGGWLFAVVYAGLFISLGHASAWLGGVFGLVHGLFLLSILPAVPHFHPRMVSEYSNPEADARLEPPGFLGLNYGYRTPVTTLIGQVVYGVVFGAGFGAVN